MTLSPITSAQWKSVLTNTLIAAASAFLATVQVVGVNKAGYTAGLAAAIAAVVKTVQKAYTPSV